MRAGLLDKVIDFYECVVSRDDMGAQKTEYVLKFSTRANVKNISGNRDNPNNETFFNQYKTITVWRYNQFDENYRIRYQNYYWRITNIDDDEHGNVKIIQVEKIND